MIPQPREATTPSRAALAATAHLNATTAANPSHSLRWVQLALGIVCMAMIANVQYGWTLFVAPMEAKHHWAWPRSRLPSRSLSWLRPGWCPSRAGSSIASVRAR